MLGSMMIMTIYGKERKNVKAAIEYTIQKNQEALRRLASLSGGRERNG